MRTFLSAKLGTYAALAGLGLLLALLVGRPEPAALAAPFALAAALGLATWRLPRFEVTFDLDRARAIEGELVFLEVRIAARRPLAWLQVHAPLPVGLEVEPGAAGPAGIRLHAGQQQVLRIPIRCRRWGAYRIGRLWLRSHDALGFWLTEDHLERDVLLRVYPGAETVRRLVRPAETQAFAGNQVSRRSGEGIEFAGTRPFVPGDLVRHVNWRLTTRLGVLHTNQQHLERNADVVLLLDTFSDTRGPAGGTLELTVRATASLADHYLRQRDRVGLLSFGGSLRWLLPATGVRQGYRIIEALLDTQVVLSYAWKGIEVIPPRTLPPKALVVALSPLLDRRTIQALFDLRGRGFDLAIIEVSPVSFVAAGQDQVGQLSFRLWQLQREVVRVKLRSIGVPVATWSLGQPLSAAIEEVSAFRRSARTVHV